MKKLIIIALPLLLIALLALLRPQAALVHATALPQAQPAATSAEALDRLLAPIALYPDQLLAQILMSAQNPGSIEAFRLWIDKNPNLKGTELQDAATKQGFDASLVVLALFPQVVKMMSDQLEWTTNLGVAFTAERSAVFASIQRLRKQANDVGTLKSSPQQTVQTKTTSTGENVIVIEPANPQVVYVPQYNTTTVYTQAPTSTVVVVEDDNSDEAIAAGMIGFTAGIAMGAAMNNSYYYGPYGMYGGAYMYNDAWDDYYDAREDAREDWSDHREDIVEERGDRAGNTQEQRTERQQNRQENRPEGAAQAAREQRSGSAQTQAATTGTRASGAAERPSTESRGYGSGQAQQVRQRSTSSDAFSGYGSGRSEQAARQRGTTSRGAATRSRGGGGRRR
jgi:hypothetical protein